MEGETSLYGFAMIIGITAVGAVIMGGVIALIYWIGSLALVAIARALKPSHPIVAEEEID